MDKIKSTFGTVGILAYFALGFVQVAGVYAFFHNYLEWNFIVSIILGWFVVLGLPFLTIIMGPVGAVHAWDWNVFGAIIFYTFPLIVYASLFIFAGTRELIASRVKVTK